MTPVNTLIFMLLLAFPAIAQDNGVTLKERVDMAVIKYEETKGSEDTKIPLSFIGFAYENGAAVYGESSDQYLDILEKLSMALLETDKVSIAYSIAVQKFKIIKEQYGEGTIHSIPALRLLTLKDFNRYNVNDKKPFSNFMKLVEKYHPDNEDKLLKSYIHIARSTGYSHSHKSIFKKAFKKATALVKKNPNPTTEQKVEIELLRYLSVKVVARSMKVIQKKINDKNTMLFEILEKFPLEELSKHQLDIIYSSLHDNFTILENYEESEKYAALAMENSNKHISKSENELIPRVLAEPKIPAKWARSGQKYGEVTVEFTVTKLGETQDIKIIDNIGDEILKRPAIIAAKQFKYKPKIVNGEAVEVNGVTYKFRFQMAK